MTPNWHIVAIITLIGLWFGYNRGFKHGERAFKPTLNNIIDSRIVNRVDRFCIKGE